MPSLMITLRLFADDCLLYNVEILSYCCETLQLLANETKFKEICHLKMSQNPQPKANSTETHTLHQTPLAT